MSGHLRFGFAAFLLVAGFVTPAASNPFTDLFSPKAAPEAPAAAPAPAQEECLLQPGKSTAPGQRWVYHHDGHRKCWFQAEAGTALARKVVHRHVAQPHTALEENESAPRKQEEAFADARDELRSPTVETSEAAPHVPEIKLVDATPVPPTGTAGLMPAAPIVGKAVSDQVTSGHPTPPQLNEEALLAAAPAVPDPVDTFADSTAPAVAPTPEASEAGQWSVASWLGMLLMALGGIALLGARRTRRRWSNSSATRVLKG